MKTSAILVDIDGTIANNQHRQIYLKDNSKDWDKFFISMAKDKPILENINVISRLRQSGHKVIITTGRPIKYEVFTIKWLDKHIGKNNYELYQRKQNDFRSSLILKKEFLHLIQELNEIVAIFEDQIEIIEMYKNEGYLCINPKK